VTLQDVERAIRRANRLRLRYQAQWNPQRADETEELYNEWDAAREDALAMIQNVGDTSLYQELR
jgi:hypothetical protein